MNIHLKNSLVSILKFLVFAGLVFCLAYIPVKLKWLGAEDLYSGFERGLVVLLGGGTAVWLLFKMTSEVFKTMLHRCYRLEDAFISGDKLHLVTYGVRSGGEESSYTEYFSYIIDLETGKLKIEKSARDKHELKKAQKQNVIKAKFKKNGEMKYATISKDEIKVAISPFSIFFGFDEGLKICAFRGDEMVWRKKI